MAQIKELEHNDEPTFEIVFLKRICICCYHVKTHYVFHSDFDNWQFSTSWIKTDRTRCLNTRLKTEYMNYVINCKLRHVVCFQVFELTPVSTSVIQV